MFLQNVFELIYSRGDSKPCPIFLKKLKNLKKEENLLTCSLRNNQADSFGS